MKIKRGICLVINGINVYKGYYGFCWIPPAPGRSGADIRNRIAEHPVANGDQDGNLVDGRIAIGFTYSPRSLDNKVCGDGHPRLNVGNGQGIVDGGDESIVAGPVHKSVTGIRYGGDGCRFSALN